MFEYLDFIPMPGKTRGRTLRLMTLSTCGYCRKARQFLEKNELEYLFVEVDSLDKSIRNRIRKDFYKAYRKIITYPTLLIGGEDELTGFDPDSWGSSLLEKGDPYGF